MQALNITRADHDTTFTEAVPSASFRRAYAYRVVDSNPEVWRIRIEQFPEHVEPGFHGWYGGRVLWGSDQSSREGAEAIARTWAEDGVLP